MEHRTPRLRPLGIGDLLDEMVRIYRSHFILLAGISAVVLAPLYLIYDFVSLALGIGGNPLAEASGTALIAFGLFAIVWGILMIVAGMAVALATTYAVSEVYLGNRPTIRAAYSGGLKRLGGAIGLSTVAGLAIGLMSITIIGIIPAVYFGVCWIVSLQVLLLEGLGIRASLSRSRALVRGHWWRMVAIGILLTIIGWVIGIVLSLPSGILTGIGFFMASGFMATLVRLVGMVFGVANTILVTPIAFCALVLLYYDLRVRKEGLDLELMAQAIDPSPETNPAV